MILKEAAAAASQGETKKETKETKNEESMRNLGLKEEKT